jgi:DNA mismatch endonuclease (patch repair protein)
MDTVDKKKRSIIMGSVRSKETELEIKFRKLLWAKGFRYRKNSRKYFGTPDIIMSSKKVVIFIDSCFWHGCPLHTRIPKTNKKFWKDKISRNIERDKEVTKYYKRNDWMIIRVWEHDINKRELLNKKLGSVTRKILEK